MGNSPLSSLQYNNHCHYHKYEDSIRIGWSINHLSQFDWEASTGYHHHNVGGSIIQQNSNNSPITSQPVHRSPRHLPPPPKEEHSSTTTTTSVDQFSLFRQYRIRAQDEPRFNCLLHMKASTPTPTTTSATAATANDANAAATDAVVGAASSTSLINDTNHTNDNPPSSLQQTQPQPGYRIGSVTMKARSYDQLPHIYQFTKDMELLYSRTSTNTGDWCLVVFHVDFDLIGTFDVIYCVCVVVATVSAHNSHHPSFLFDYSSYDVERFLPTFY